MSYKNPYILTEKAGNNAFAWEERQKKYGANPQLWIPSFIEGTLDDVEIGDQIVFEEVEDGTFRSCKGLKNFIRLPNQLSSQSANQSITIFDNHNHALYFWLEAVRDGILKPGFELIHIDEHSDLWSNEYTLDLKKALENEKYAWEFTNFSCNVGNYINPALQSGLIGKMIRIENEFELDQNMEYIPNKNSVLNLDLDFFAPEMEFIDEEKKITFIRNLMKKVRCVTIATSPHFINQGLAIAKLKKIMSE